MGCVDSELTMFHGCVVVGLLIHTAQWRRWTIAAAWNVSQSSRYGTLLWKLVIKLCSFFLLTIFGLFILCSATSNLPATHVASMSSITWWKQCNYYVWMMILRYISQFKTHAVMAPFFHASIRHVQVELSMYYSEIWAWVIYNMT